MRLLLPVLLFISSFSYGQKILLGVSGGMGYSTPPAAITKNIKNAKPVFGNMVAKGSVSPIVSIKTGFDQSGFQIGLAAEFGSNKFSYSSKDDKYSTIYSYTSESKTIFIKPQFYLNYKLNLPRSYCFFGVNLGYAMYESEIVKASGKYTTYSVSHEISVAKKSEISFGAQFGYSYKILDGLYAQASVAADYMPVDADIYLVSFMLMPEYSAVEKSHLFYFPVTLGIAKTF